MFSFNEKLYDAHEFYSFTKSGVNIFNVDRTVHSEEFFHEIKTAMVDSQRLFKTYTDKKSIPISLAVTMSVEKPLEIDESVDIIILKDVTNCEDILKYKKQRNSVIPILLWIKAWNVVDMKQMIKFSDGVIADLTSDTKFLEENCINAGEMCREACKPIFHVLPDVVKDYRGSLGDERRMLVVAKNIVVNQLDGVVLTDDNSDDEINRKQIIQLLIKAIDVIGEMSDIDNEYYNLSFKIKTPVLPPMSAALAASIAAKQSSAGVIIVLSSTGASARLVSCAAPPCHILAVTARKTTVRRLHLYRKVVPVFYDQARSTIWRTDCFNRVLFGTTLALKTGFLRSGAKLVVLAPSTQDSSYCNGIQIVSVPFNFEDLIF